MRPCSSKSPSETTSAWRGGREDSDEYWDEEWDEEASYNHDVDEAVCDIIAGRPFRDGLAQPYADALIRLLKHFGRALPRYFLYGNMAFSVDRALVRSGIPPGAFDMVGHLMHRARPSPSRTRAITRTSAISGSTRWARPCVPSGRRNWDVNADFRGAVAELRGWLEACSAEGRDLVCYYT